MEISLRGKTALVTGASRGIGKAMMHLLLDALREKGSKGVHLGMGATNSRAFTFYTKLGFTLLDKNETAFSLHIKRSILSTDKR